MHKSSPGLDHFRVITTVSNLERFRSRYALYGRFMAGMSARGITVHTVEVAYGDRPFEVTEAGNPLHLQLRSHSPFWNKEAALNRGVQSLPLDCTKFAWVDADVEFVRPDWAEETCHQLERFPVVQLFEDAIDLGPTGGHMAAYKGWGAAYVARSPRPGYIDKRASLGPKGHPGRASSSETTTCTCKDGKGRTCVCTCVCTYPYPGDPPPPTSPIGYQHWHPGYGWAYRREAYETLGGFLDFAPLGAADHHMAWSFVGEVENTLPHKGITDAFRRRLLAWQENARELRGHIGYVPGLLLHHWHGPKADRKYNERWRPVVEHGFDPDRDIKKDVHGLWRFTYAGERMRLDFEQYFRQRNEDAVSL